MTDTYNRERFNHWSETYDQSYLQWLLFNRVHRGVLSRIPASFTPSSILDLGCGTGRLLYKLSLRWPAAALVGVDLSEGMLAHARLNLPTALLYQASAEHLPLADRSIVLTTSTVSFHHWTDQAQGICEVARVLMPGACFILADTNIGHGQPRSRAELRDLFQSAGLVIHSQSSPVPFFTFTVARKD